MDLLETMMNNAADLNDSSDENAEYLRGQAELICETLGISTDEKDRVVTTITMLSTVRQNIAHLRSRITH